MNVPALINIDSGLAAIDKKDASAEVIDTYVCTYSFGLMDTEKREEHLLELVTNEPLFWDKLVRSADTRYWIKSENFGIVVYKPNQDCGYTRTYRYREKNNTVKCEFPLNSEELWIKVRSESDFLNVVNTIEFKAVFNAWKAHKTEINATPTEFAEGRLQNTDVDRVWIVTKGDGCAVCGKEARYQARTTLTAISSLLLAISLCPQHHLEAQEHPCVLVFFGSLFTLQLEVGDLVKLDYIPEQLIEPIRDLIASNLKAKCMESEKRHKGWHMKFVMDDGWYWILRLNTFSDYGYMLFDNKKKQKHRIDSANHHGNVPFGPDHQHFNSSGKKQEITPSFTYGLPALDFPALINARKFYK